jgi:SAM-dependent methyltransferase
MGCSTAAQDVVVVVGRPTGDAVVPLRPVRLEIRTVFAHMLPCMALSTDKIEALVGEVGRALRPGGTFVCTVRHTGDAHNGTGTGHGDHVWQQGGFAVHVFDRDLVDGWPTAGTPQRSIRSRKVTARSGIAPLHNLTLAG